MEIVRSVATKGPVSVCFDVVDGFQLYTSGVYTKCVYHCNGVYTYIDFFIVLN